MAIIQLNFWYLSVLPLFFLSSSVLGGDEQTTGLFLDNGATEGFTLYSPLDGVGSYLVNNDGEIVHRWSDPDGLTEASITLLTEQGTILRGAKVPSDLFSPVYSGRIREFSKNGECIWEFRYFSEEYRLNSLFSILPNGNVLAIAVQNYPISEAQSRGYTGEIMTNPEGFHAETIIEVPRIGYLNPNYKSGTYDGDLDNSCLYISDERDIIWKWEVIEHSSDKLDERTININTNYILFSIDYLPERNHIVVDGRFGQEILIIGHRGSGYYNEGEILWRWGNSAAYGGSGEQPVLTPIGVNWNSDNYGWHFDNRYRDVSLTVTNLVDSENSSGVSFLQITPQYHLGKYAKLDNGDFAPLEEDRKITSRKGLDDQGNVVEFDILVFFPLVQLLPNQNAFVTQLTDGTIFELDTESFEVWRYVSPASASDSSIFDVKQPDLIIGESGEVPMCVFFTCNGMLKATKYSPGYRGIRRLLRSRQKQYGRRRYRRHHHRHRWYRHRHLY